MTSPYERLHADAMQHYALAHHHLTKLKETLDEMAVGQGTTPAPSSAPVRCVREWADWLAVNGPSIKGDIQDSTGVRFTERGTKYTVEWVPSMAAEPDDRFPPNALMKIGSKPDGRGAPPKIFFLWSQRFDVYPKFGVGPSERPEPIETDGAPADDLPWDEVAVDVDGPMRYATMAEWDQAHGPLFDALVSSDAKPTDEQKQMLKDTLPEGAEPNASIAIGYRSAVERARQQPMLGVVQPPET